MKTPKGRVLVGELFFDLLRKSFPRKRNAEHKFTTPGGIEVKLDRTLDPGSMFIVGSDGNPVELDDARIVRGKTEFEFEFAPKSEGGSS